MLQFKGLVEREISGKKVFFKFNMAAMTMLGDLQNLSMADLGVELANPKFSTVANFLYAGAKVYDRQEKPKEPQNFSQDDAAEWLSQMGLSAAMDLFNEAFDAPETKNGEAPK